MLRMAALTCQRAEFLLKPLQNTFESFLWQQQFLPPSSCCPAPLRGSAEIRDGCNSRAVLFIPRWKLCARALLQGEKRRAGLGSESQNRSGRKRKPGSSSNPATPPALQRPPHVLKCHIHAAVKSLRDGRSSPALGRNYLGGFNPFQSAGQSCRRGWAGQGCSPSDVTHPGGSSRSSPVSLRCPRRPWDPRCHRYRRG